MAMRPIDSEKLYDDERERHVFMPDDDREFEVRASVMKHHPYAAYLSIFHGDDPTGTPRVSANLSAQELIDIGQDFIALGERLITEYRREQDDA